MMKESKIFLIYLFLFIIFLVPFSISLGNEDGASANYSFLLFPFLFGLINGKYYKPDKTWLLFIFIYFSIFLIASLYQFNFLQYFSRRFVSFFLFMSIFSFLFIKIDENMIKAFKLSLITISLIFSLFTLFKFILLGASDLGFSAKGEVGSQRFGFVYVLSLWLLFINDNKKYKILNKVLIILILIGLLLTFSRSGIVALLLSFFIFIIFKIKNWFLKPTIKGLYIGLITILIVIALLLYINYKFPIIFDFFYQRLFSYFESNSTQEIDLDESSSEGYRLFMLKKVLNFVLHNPLTGAGFLGVWILFDDQSGSAHGQFVDVIFRTGTVGLFIYLIILFKLLKFFFTDNKGYFWGVIGIIFYGFFHETFKLSHGSFILAFLIGHVSQFDKKNLIEK